MRDYDIRTILKSNQLKKYKEDGVSRIVEEMKLPAAYARIDIAVINGHLHGYEIKSASDTLQRLPGQIEAYTKVFDYLYVVTEGKHCAKMMEHLPDWVGVYICSGNVDNPKIKKLRSAKINCNRDGFYIAKLLWRDELIQTLQQYNIAFKKKDRNWILCETLSNNLHIDVLSQVVREKLKTRPSYWKHDVTIADINE